MHLVGKKGLVVAGKLPVAAMSRWWVCYGAALAAVIAAVLVRFGLDSILGERGPFATFFPAVAVAVFLGRLPGGLLAILLSTLSADYLFFSPRHMLGIQGTPQATDLMMFMVGAGIIVVFGEAMHRAREKAEALRKEAHAMEERASQIVETANEGIWILDAKARVIKVNPRFGEMLGYTAAEMLGAKQIEFVFPEDISSVQELFDRRRRGVSEQADVRFRAKNGSEVWTLMAARPLFDESGAFQGALDMFTEITQRKKAEEELERIVAERTDRLHEIAREMELFSYSMAHDLRAPLRAMQGLSKVVLEDFGDCLPEEGKQHLIRLADSADRMDRLILDVLHYSHLVRGELPLQEVAVQRLINDMVNSFPDLQDARQHIRIEGPLPPVLANPAALTQVISNLLTNAVKFVAPGVTPRVRVWAESTLSEVRLFVEDNGIGIPLKAQQKIFGLFQRLHAPDAYEGTGIGLAIVKKATERMGGRVGLESEAGKGSRFWITLQSSPPATHQGEPSEVHHELQIAE